MTSMLLSLLLLLPFLALSTSELENCGELANQTSCLTKVFVACPTTCATLLRPAQFSVGGRPRGASDFYDLQVKDVHKETISFEKYEGTLTLVLALPKDADADFAKFHYVLLQRLQNIYPWTLEVLMVSGVEFETSSLSKVAVFPQTPDQASPVMKYLVSLVQKGKYESANLNAFLLSPNGDDLQMHIWQEIHTLRKYIDSFMKDLSDEL